MQIEVKSYCPARGSAAAQLIGNRPSTNELVGGIVFKANNEVDAIQLAALASAWMDGTSAELRKLREDSLRAFMEKHRVIIRIEEKHDRSGS